MSCEVCGSEPEHCTHGPVIERLRRELREAHERLRELERHAEGRDADGS